MAEKPTPQSIHLGAVIISISQVFPPHIYWFLVIHILAKLAKKKYNMKISYSDSEQ